MREIQTEIDIAAPLAKVWEILKDINQWHVWSPIINGSSGVASNGEKLTITMIGENGKDGPKYMPVITDLDEPKLFRWRAKMMAGFLFTNDKIFILKETEAGTHLTHTEAFSGMMVPMCWSKLNDNVPGMLNSMNEALKTLAEKKSD